MKYLLSAILLFSLNTVSFAQHKATQSKKTTSKVKTDKYHDNIDDRMKGPAGEVIYIGSSGGRYYLKNGKKIYVTYKGNKKK